MLQPLVADRIPHHVLQTGVKCLGINPRGFLFQRRALEMPRGNPQGVQSPQALIWPLPDRLAGDGEASDRPCFWT